MENFIITTNDDFEKYGYDYYDTLHNVIYKDRMDSRLVDFDLSSGMYYDYVENTFTLKLSRLSFISYCNLKKIDLMKVMEKKEFYYVYLYDASIEKRLYDTEVKLMEEKNNVNTLILFQRNIIKKVQEMNRQRNTEKAIAINKQLCKLLKIKYNGIPSINQQ